MGLDGVAVYHLQDGSGSSAAFELRFNGSGHQSTESDLRLEVLQPFLRLIQRPQKLSVYFDLLGVAELRGRHLGAKLSVEEFAVAAKHGTVALAKENGVVAAQLIRHDHRGPTRSLVRSLLQQLVCRFLIVDNDKCHPHYRHGADAAVKVLVLEPMLVLGRAIGGDVFNVSQYRKRFGAGGQFALALSVRLLIYKIADQNNDTA